MDQTTVYRIEMIKTKLKTSSLFMHQALYSLIKKKGNANRMGKNESKTSYVHRLLLDIRDDHEVRNVWITAVSNKYQDLDRDFALVLDAIQELMGYHDVADGPSDSFWTDLYKHVLDTSYVFPDMYFSTEELTRSVTVMKESWEDFIMQNVRLVPSTLSSVDLERLERKVPERLERKVQERLEIPDHLTVDLQGRSRK